MACLSMSKKLKLKFTFGLEPQGAEDAEKNTVVDHHFLAVYPFKRPRSRRPCMDNKSQGT